MSFESELIKKFKCIECNKLFSSSNSLCNHKKKYHKNEIAIDVKENVKDVKENVKDKNIKKFKCEYCNKIFSSRQSKSEHKIKACKIIKSNTNNQLNNINNEINNRFV